MGNGKKVCENKGGHLAVITSQSEQNTINELISSGNLHIIILVQQILTT